MTDAKPITSSGNDHLTILLELVGRTSASQATLERIASDVQELRNNTSRQIAALQERVGTGEALNNVQDEQIKQLTLKVDAMAGLADRIDALEKRLAYYVGAAAVGGAVFGAVLVEVISRLIGV